MFLQRRGDLLMGISAFGKMVFHPGIGSVLILNKNVQVHLGQVPFARRVLPDTVDIIQIIYKSIPGQYPLMLVHAVDVKYKDAVLFQKQRRTFNRTVKIRVLGQMIERVQRRDDDIHLSRQVKLGHALRYIDNVRARLHPLVHRLGQHLIRIVGTHDVIPESGHYFTHASRSAAHVQQNALFPTMTADTFVKVPSTRRVINLQRQPVIYAGKADISAQRDPPLLLFFRVQAVKYHLVSVAAIIQRSLDAGNGRGGCSGRRDNIRIDLLFTEHPCNLNPLGHCLQFGYGAEIFKKIIALFHRL